MVPSDQQVGDSDGLQTDNDSGGQRQWRASEKQLHWRALDGEMLPKVHFCRDCQRLGAGALLAKNDIESAYSLA